MNQGTLNDPAGTGLLPIWLAIADGSRAAGFGAGDRINRTMSPMSVERSPENVAVLPGRLGVVDAARAVAVLGMVIIHFGPNPVPDTVFGNLYEVPHGRASVLFVLLVEMHPRVSWPLVATGQLALSVYVGHLLLLDSYEELLRYEALPAAATSVGMFMLLAATTCVLWRAALPRGPLEATLATPWWTFERVARLRTAHGRDGRAPVAAAQGSREREDHRIKRATAKSQVRE